MFSCPVESTRISQSAPHRPRWTSRSDPSNDGSVHPSSSIYTTDGPVKARVPLVPLILQPEVWLYTLVAIPLPHLHRLYFAASLALPPKFLYTCLAPSPFTRNPFLCVYLPPAGAFVRPSLFHRFPLPSLRASTVSRNQFP